MKTFNIFCFFAAIVLIQLAPVCFAQTQTDWVIRDFSSTITVNKDSSLLIEERITADADGLPDKHGIFRVLPTQTKTDAGTFKTPVQLIGITDFSGKPQKFSTINNGADHTITWKIGDPNVTVTGLNYYKITYLVKNAIRFGNPDFDELYWNLNGNFWQIPTDKFSARIIFPGEINQNNTRVSYYAGILGSQANDMANYSWSEPSVLEINSTQELAPGQGITASVTFPKNIFTSYVPTFWDLYGDYFWFLIPLAAFLICYKVWDKYGKDPRVDKTIIPEFEIPENLMPMEMGMLYSNGSFKNEFIASTIVDLAVKKRIVIEEIKKSWFLGGKDFKLKKISNEPLLESTAQGVLLNALLGGKDEVMLSSLKNSFYQKIPVIKNAAIADLKQKDLIDPSGLKFRILFIVIALVFFFAVFGAAGTGLFGLAIALAVSAVIILVFGLLMPRRTSKGAELNWRIKGFRLYMETAEKYRSQFNEKENIFEKFLPYAIMFGIAKLWAQKMEMIYGKEYFATYHPIWYVGAIGNFNADSFAANLNSLSSSIAANAGTASGAGGGGFAGGGGGGGGGGGW